MQSAVESDVFRSGVPEDDLLGSLMGRVLLNLPSFNRQLCGCFPLAFCLKHVSLNLSQKLAIFLSLNVRNACTWGSEIIDNVSAAVVVLMESVVS